MKTKTKKQKTKQNKEKNGGTAEYQKIDINLYNDTILYQCKTCEEIRNIVKKLIKKSMGHIAHLSNNRNDGVIIQHI